MTRRARTRLALAYIGAVVGIFTGLGVTLVMLSIAFRGV